MADAISAKSRFRPATRATRGGVGVLAEWQIRVAMQVEAPQGWIMRHSCSRDCGAWLRCLPLIYGLEVGPMVEELKTWFSFRENRADRTSKFLPSEDEKLSLLPAVLVIVLLSAALWADIIAAIVWII